MLLLFLQDSGERCRIISETCILRLVRFDCSRGVNLPKLPRPSPENGGMMANLPLGAGMSPCYPTHLRMHVSEIYIMDGCS